MNIVGPVTPGLVRYPASSASRSCNSYVHLNGSYQVVSYAKRTVIVDFNLACVLNV